MFLFVFRLKKNAVCSLMSECVFVLVRFSYVLPLGRAVVKFYCIQRGMKGGVKHY